MKNISISIFLIWMLSSCSAQNISESQKFLTESLNQKDVEKKELLPELIDFNYSTIWTQNDTMILGFIGDNYQRIKIKFLSIIKNAENPSNYYIYGKSMVDSSVRDFIGEIEIVNIRRIIIQKQKEILHEADNHKDEETIKKISAKRYMLVAKYILVEDPTKSKTGVFKGIAKSTFIIENKRILYDESWRFSDSFSNNQFVGTWTSYSNSAVLKRCNWGEFRIPYSGDLDIGSGEFSLNEKYIQNGWGNYYRAFVKNDTMAMNEEKKKWWR